MSIDRSLGIIRRSLSLNDRSGRSASVEEVADWLEELVDELGSVDPDRLKASLKAAWSEHHGAGKFGRIVPADVVAAYRSGVGGPTLSELLPEGCGDCRKGVVVVRRDDGATVAVACMCEAGKARQDAQPNAYPVGVEAMLEQGWARVGDCEVVR